MVSTRRKSYQPTSASTPDPGGRVPPSTTARPRHSSLSVAPVSASPRRSRRASSLTPLETEGRSSEAVQARGHRTKALLERYRSEVKGSLKMVEEEAGPVVRPEEEDEETRRKDGEPAEAEETSAAPSVKTVAESADEAFFYGFSKETVEEAATGLDAEDAEQAHGQAHQPMESSQSLETNKEPTSLDVKRKDKKETERVKASKSKEVITGIVSRRVEETVQNRTEVVKECLSQDNEEMTELAFEVEEENEIDVEAVEADDKSVEKEAAARRMEAAQRVLASVTGVTSPAEVEVHSPAPVTPASPPASAPAAKPAFTRIRPAPKPRGMAKSGRFWKSVRTRASKVVVRDSVSYEKRMKKRQQQQVVKDLENQLKNERKQKLEDLRKRREYNAKKAAENALKAEVFQVVKNPNKIKRMKKKQLRLLQKRDTTVVGKSVLEE